MRTITSKDFRFRVGLTLVELLVVVGVISVLAAIVLPSIKSVLTDRKSSQSAIIVKNFIEAARSRAIGRNRSVAVVLERLSSRIEPGPPPYASATAVANPISPDGNFLPYNACIRMSLAEEPLPFRDSMLPASIVMFPRSASDNLNPPFPTTDYVDEDELVDSHGGAEVRAFRVSGPDASLEVLAKYLISGAEIRFANSTRRFSIVSPRTPAVHENYISNGQGIWFSVVNEIAAEESGERASSDYAPFMASESNGISQFRIYSRPKPIFTEMVQLPRGMCIDLSLSGFASDVARNDVATLPPVRPIFDAPTPMNLRPLSDYRVRFASDWIGNGNVPTPEQLRPIYLVFTPDGGFSHVWANERVGRNLVRIDAVQDVFLHIGKIDQVVMPLSVVRTAQSALAAINAGIKQNVTDLNGYVVRLSPRSGAISASPVLSVQTQIEILGLNPSNLSFGDWIELSRRGTYSTNVTAQ